MKNFFILNSQHNDIKFTIEKTTDTLAFLDVEIKLNDTSFDTTVYRKPTNTGLYLNFFANCPKQWKSGLILCLLHRAKLICSNNELLKNEIKNLQNLFIKNAYSN